MFLTKLRGNVEDNSPATLYAFEIVPLTCKIRSEPKAVGMRMLRSWEQQEKKERQKKIQERLRMNELSRQQNEPGYNGLDT